MQKAVILAMTMVIGIPVTAAEAYVPPPTAVTAVSDGTEATVTWVPPVALLDVPNVSFEIYARDGSAWVHLKSVGPFVPMAKVPGSFAVYGVSTKVAGVESNISAATICIYFPPLQIQQFC